MLDHVGFPVSDLPAARRFYGAAHAPLAYAVLMEVSEAMTGGHGTHVGYGPDGKPDFRIGTGKPAARGVHVPIAAVDPSAVDAFHAQALTAGGTDHGAPGLRPQNHTGYSGVLVLDPGGNTIEAVFCGAG